MRRGLVGLSILVVSVAAFLFLKGGEGEALEEKGVRDALSARKYPEAERLVDAWIAARPKDARPLYYKARLEVILDRPAKAMDSMRLAVDRGYPLPPIEVLRAVLQARAGQADKAEPVLRQALLSSKEPMPEVAEGLARICLATFRLGEASAALQRWKEADPDDARPYLWSTQIDERTGAEPMILIQNYRAALERDPKLDEARIGLAKTLLRNKDLDDAEAEFESYLARNPTSVEGHNGAGEVALLKGKLPEASEHFKASLAIQPDDPSALQNLAQLELRLGRFPSARDLFRKAVEISPFDTELRYHYARALKMSGDEAKAAEESATTQRLREEQKEMEALRKALVERPDDADLRSKAARWLIEHGHDKEGLQWTELILRQKPGHPPTCRLLADYHARKGNFGLANYYRTAGASERPAPRP